MKLLVFSSLFFFAITFSFNPVVSFPFNRGPYPKYDQGVAVDLAIDDSSDARAMAKDLLVYIGAFTADELVDWEVTMTEGAESGMTAIWAGKVRTPLYTLALQSGLSLHIISHNTRPWKLPAQLATETSTLSWKFQRTATVPQMPQPWSTLKQILSTTPLSALASTPRLVTTLSYLCRTVDGSLRRHSQLKWEVMA
jgi:hypothetical protein